MLIFYVLQGVGTSKVETRLVDTGAGDIQVSVDGVAKDSLSAMQLNVAVSDPGYNVTLEKTQDNELLVTFDTSSVIIVVGSLH